jgi:hypothetical protein
VEAAAIGIITTFLWPSAQSLHNGRADDAVITIHFIVDHTAPQEGHHFVHHFVHHYHFIGNIIPDLLT